MYANYELCLYASGSVPIQFKFELKLLLLGAMDRNCQRTNFCGAASHVRVFRKYLRMVLRRGQYYGKVIYSHTTFFPGICHCMLISRFPNYATHANELTVVDSYL